MKHLLKYLFRDRDRLPLRDMERWAGVGVKYTI
jgi:hypothetical protein